ncbi:phospholipase D family protein [Terrisporobacter petrolearius]|uniref:phospholipase D family protein n=1 Tax=Terrisporobacter petrolearius TaxID=1460447 RepID=UPI003AFF71DD
MYYWDKYNVNKISLKNELLSLEYANELYIGTAYLSEKGLLILKEIIEKYNLKKNKVHIYLSYEFSQNNPDQLLEELNKISEVKILFNRIFHSKVYYLKGSNDKLVFGSSNLTSGGFENNIEFDCIKEIDNDEELVQIKLFFDFCDLHGEKVSEEVIKYYRDNESIFHELTRNQNSIRKKLKGFKTKDDALDESWKEILKDFYFLYADYETLFIRNRKRTDIEINKQRKKIQEKILDIHDTIYPEIKKLGVNCHWSPNHVTSVIRPCEYNRGKVEWVGVRYGKTKSEIQSINSNLNYKNKNKDEIKGFQKHACLQYCILSDSVEISLFLAVRRDAVDRNYLLEHIDEIEPSIIKELSKLRGHNMVWEIYNDVEGKFEQFFIDKDNLKDFCDFIKKNDGEGCESYLKLLYKPDDERIKDKDAICKEIIFYMNKLINLYNLISWRPKF